ncbi:hypothetical protein ACQEVS_31545 [Streptomyces sp. CA-181903]|uniref:hypothetical protein n=1 Tax=Streptomyces sp. CA-181903 TaxID=3240055 RepID=UPI003D8F3BF8
MTGYVVSFLLGLGLGGLGPVLRRRRTGAVRPPVAVQESVTAFGEEVAALEIEADDTDVSAVVLKEYQAALEAYGRASAARTESDALTALRDGRAAVIRLDARREGRPVPIDALPPAPVPGRPRVLTGTGERHVATGSGGGRTEVLIDRPEPGRPALVEVDVTGGGNFELKTVTRTEELVRTGQSLIWTSGEYRGRYYLPADVTHLRVTTDNSRRNHRWSTRVLPLSAATVLATEHRGHGDEVLRYNGGPALAIVQIQTDAYWSVDYVCQCLQPWYGCGCRSPTWPVNTPGDGAVSGSGEGRRTLRLPRPGFLVIHGGPWYLTTQQVAIPSPPPRWRRWRR